MRIAGVEIEDDFAEAFGMVATRIVVTADTPAWVEHAARSMTGFATSVIGCGCEAGIERRLAPEETPDGRPGAAILLFAISPADLARALALRVGQSILTCPTTACFSGLEAAEQVPLGRALRYFGDGFQTAKRIGDRRYWRVPVMDGEFVAEDRTGMVPAVGGGNILIVGAARAAALAAAERAVAAMCAVPDVVMPFPGGVVRSGSKVGSRYKALMASTNDAWCPTLRGQTASRLPPDAAAVMEIVIDGLSADAVGAAMRAGILAACEGGPAAGVLRIGAGNYGGKLGQFHFRLRELLA
ncbi:formylmethanofuran--tetrahydromethanopterin N-formyltransferase [Azospirillum halopraeferens]|uniref:formylmethanofuran--tetrahydromethanopterin N-formyltransferase n=1 Tax=Azospirillum halopraeferens TaxID=34010 RepID=UPI0004289589|nr:formylmethanofuran--tetrahydromethanopterin N-formyltransferase [Azospirillum halopraeferens]